MAREKPRVRTISSLSQEQIQRKRDTDRRAQRASRERTNSRIQALEEELAVLRAARCRDEEAFTAEISTLRQSNEALQQQLHGLLEEAPQPSTHRSSSLTSEGYDAIVDNDDPLSAIDISPPPEDIQHLTPHESPPTFEPNVEEPNEHTLEQDQLTYEMAAHVNGHIEKLPAEIRTPSGSWSYSEEADPLAEKDEYLDGIPRDETSFSTTTSISSANSSSIYIPSNNAMLEQPTIRPGTTVWTTLPQHLPATCPLDHILINFLSSRRLLKAKDSLISIVGPPIPSISGLLHSDFITRHPVSRVMVEVVATFKHVNIQEKLAFLYIMHATMRWQIASSKESFEHIPRWLRPTCWQVVTPHAAWIDNIPWPHMRDILIQHPLQYPFEEFSEMYSRNVKLTWPHEPLDAVIQSTTNVKEFTLNPIFEKHIRKLQNWSMGDAFKKQYPELVPAMMDP